MVPTRVETVDGWVTVTGGSFHGCGVRTDRSLWCWGSNYSGALGVGSHEPISRLPVQVKIPG